MVEPDHQRGRATEFWLIYETGAFDRLDTRTGRCEHFPQLAKALRELPFLRYLHVDQRGNLWGIIQQQGIFHYNVARNQFTRFRRLTHGLVSDTVNAITGDAQGRIWVVTPDGLSQLTLTDRRVWSTRFPRRIVSLQTMALKDEHVGAIAHTNGEIMVNNRTSLLFIDPRRSSVRTVPFADRPSIDQPLLSRGADGDDYLVADGTLYRYTDSQGLIPLWHYTPLPGAPFKQLLPSSLCVDRSGVVWLGANTLGLFRMDLAANPFKAYTYQTTFCSDALQTGMGLSLSNHLNWPFEDIGSQSSYIFRADYDQRGGLWLGVGNEVGRYDPHTRMFNRLPNPRMSPDSKQDAFLRGLSISPDGRVWIVTQTGTPLYYDTLTRHWQAPFGPGAPIQSVHANDLLADANTLWVTTIRNGLLRFEPATGTHQFIRFAAAADGSGERLLDLQQDATHPTGCGSAVMKASFSLTSERVATVDSLLFRGCPTTPYTRSYPTSRVTCG
jgi:streptogramin lyase